LARWFFAPLVLLSRGTAHHALFAALLGTRPGGGVARGLLDALSGIVCHHGIERVKTHAEAIGAEQKDRVWLGCSDGRKENERARDAFFPPSCFSTILFYSKSFNKAGGFLSDTSKKLASSRLLSR
jgi:hypothetical protein